MDLTREQILAMKPGWSSNLLIAEKVMGWRWVRGLHNDVTGIEDPIWLLPPDMSVADVPAGEWTYYEEWNHGEKEPDSHRLTIFNVPNFFGDIAAAWEVVEKMKLKWTMELYTFCDMYRCRFGLDKKEPPVYAPPAPEAICRAALLAMLSREEEGH